MHLRAGVALVLLQSGFADLLEHFEVSHVQLEHFLRGFLPLQGFMFGLQLAAAVLGAVPQLPRLRHFVLLFVLVSLEVSVRFQLRLEPNLTLASLLDLDPAVRRPHFRDTGLYDDLTRVLVLQLFERWTVFGRTTPLLLLLAQVGLPASIVGLFFLRHNLDILPVFNDFLLLDHHRFVHRHKYLLVSDVALVDPSDHVVQFERTLVEGCFVDGEVAVLNQHAGGNVPAHALLHQFEEGREHGLDF